LDLDVLDSTNDFQNEGEVSSLDPDEEFDRLVFGEDEELKKKFVSEDEQNFLNNPFGENPNNPFDFLGEAGKDIKIEEDEFLEGSDEIGAFEFNMEEENSQDEEIPEENIQLNSNIEDFEFSRNRILWAYRQDAHILGVPKSADEVHNNTGKKRGPYKKKNNH
jgi:hypothetical protein